MVIKKLLVVDDEKEICQLVCDIAQACGYQAESAYTAIQFKNILIDFQPDVIILDLHILDLHLADSDGIELLRFLGESNNKAAIILISGYDQKLLSTAMLLGKDHALNMITALHKPFKASQLQNVLLNDLNAAGIVTVDQIREAIAHNYLVLHYQPQITLVDRKVFGAEALVRMQFPGQPIIYPDQFIALAEKANLINALTDWVFKEAVNELANVNKKNIDIEMSINFPSTYFDTFEVPDKLEQYVLAAGVNPARITIELTESSVHGKTKIFMDILTRLRLKNFNLAMDDFGIGYSSLIELYKMPFNFIKIDKSFVMNMTTDADAKTIVKALIHLFQELNITIIAEGVENQQILSLLEEYKCEIVQGYHFSKPISATAFVNFFNNFKQPLRAIHG